jgi:hypothetical protein
MKEDHPLGPGPRAPDIKRLKRYSIELRARLAPNSDVENLTFHLVRHKDETDAIDKKGGWEVASTQAAEVLVDEFASAVGIADDRGTPTPLDFPIRKPCVVALRLMGDFWRFAETDAVKTKEDYKDGQKHRYYGLRSHGDHAVSFCTLEPIHKDPAKPKGEAHKINLYVEFIDDQRRVTLPVILDPDIENKGDDDP